MAVDPVYDEVAGFLAELAGGGVRHIVLSPGSRSTPLSLCAAAQPELRHWVQIDERTAGFFALGLAKASRSPVALVCTSGTAVANYFPAVIEASRTGVPLIVLSADRPPELRGGWGANQTIDQVEMFGRYVRRYVEMPVGGTSSETDARGAARSVLRDVGAPQVGPVQVNWPFRKPLEPVAAIPLANVSAPPASEPGPTNPNGDLTALMVKRGAVVVGPLDDPAWTAALANFAEAAGWPILAESTSQLRLDVPGTNVVAFGDRILTKPELRAELAPEVVVFAGATPTGPVALRWAAEHQAEVVLLVDPAFPWSDSGPVEATTIEVAPAAVPHEMLAEQADPAWLTRWQALDVAVAESLADADIPAASGPAVARCVAANMPSGSHLLVANSMVVRDLDRYAAPRGGVRVHVSRGASGIDGQIATAAGIAAADVGPVALLIGDVAFLHDLSSLLAAVRSAVDLTVIVVNDDGGGIFSMLPIASSVPQDTFDEIFHTPHGTDLAVLGGFAGITHQRVASTDELAQNLTGSGVRVIEVLVDHQTNLAARQAIDELIAALVS